MLKGDLDISGDIKGPSLDVDAPNIDFKHEGVKVKMPDVSMSGPTLQGTDADFQVRLPKGNIDVSGPKIKGDMRIPGMTASFDAPEMNVKSPDGKLKGLAGQLPSLDVSAPRISGPDFDVNLKEPKLKGDLDISGVPSVVGIDAPRINILPDINLKGAKLKGSVNATGDINVPTVGISGGDLPGFARVEGSDTDMNIKLSKPTIGTSGAEIKSAIAPGYGVSVDSPDFKIDRSDISLKGPTLKIPGDLSGDIKSPKMNVNIGTESELKGPRFLPSSGMDVRMPTVTGGIHIPGQKLEGEMTGPKVGAVSQVNVNDPQSNLASPLGKVIFPKLKMPKFTYAGPELTGREVGVDVNFPKPDANIQASNMDIDLEQDVRIKKSKIKMPKFNFSKQKGKGGDVNLGSTEASVSVQGLKDLKSSKSSLGSAEGEVDIIKASSHLESEGATVSPKGKSSTFEFSLFKSKKPRHRSSSLSDEQELSSPSMPSGTQEFEGGTASLEGKKGKEKHSKLKFGTFGGLGSKTKGSYEVTLSGDEAGDIQGSGVSLTSKKS
ncbi:neuroblast differentiation-associated protein AHNAK-like [Rhinatrema bivittatum]|uniref:neuroblast differentiation-associated protein AHNAK-like n=1 Tax=Rhinatrema bivittatum TaxID=194408 RepID=UPI00112E880E|nr:neuroblast differentiation-associated protein AHNAK-like [Rhinatrema bivittatum]